MSLVRIIDWSSGELVDWSSGRVGAAFSRENQYQMSEIGLIERQTRLPRLSKARKRRRALSMARDGGQGEAIPTINNHKSTIINGAYLIESRNYRSRRGGF